MVQIADNATRWMPKVVNYVKSEGIGNVAAGSRVSRVSRGTGCRICAPLSRVAWAT